MTQAKFLNKTRGEGYFATLEYRYRARKNSSFSTIWLAAETSKKSFIFIFKISQSMIEILMSNGRSRRKNEKQEIKS